MASALRPSERTVIDSEALGVIRQVTTVLDALGVPYVT